MDLADYKSQLNDLAGLDITDAQAEDLVNEGRRRLLTDSEWRRATVDIGPTVAAQELYTAPTGLHRILRLNVNGVPCFGIDEETIEQFKTDEGMAYSLPSGAHFYYISHTSAAVDQIGLYPAPETAAYSIYTTIVKRPDDIPATGEDPDVPLEFQRYVVDYAASHAYALDEDNQALADFHMASFDRGVLELKRLRRVLLKSGPVAARIVGEHV